MIIIICAYLIDIIIGDPYNFNHPVRFIGMLIEKFEKILYACKYKKFAGLLLVVAVLLITLIITFSLMSISIIIQLFLIYTVFATRSLGNEGIKIYRLLKNNLIIKARKELSFIVSRNTENMNKEDIIRSTIESVSENINDAIIAPMFYLFLGGLPLAMLYKASSTMDSMIGYKNERYIKFGFAAAKLDDILNFIPARITGFLFIPLASLLLKKSFIHSIKCTVKFGKCHDSPNSAYGEAAVAGALNIRLGGRNIYFGKVSKKPFIGDKAKKFKIQDIKESVKIMYLTSLVALTFFIGIKLIIIGALF